MNTKIIFPAAMMLLLASCGGNPASSPAASSDPASASTSAQASSAPTFEAMTLSAIHDARVAKTLANLEGKYVTLKGKVTFAKRPNENYDALVIQNGKHAIQVDYPAPYSVNVGDSVEVKGCLKTTNIGDITTIWVSTYTDTVPGASIKVVDEAVSVETVTISKLDDLLEYDSSQSDITFSVTGNRTNAAFLGKLAQGDEEFIVANKTGIADKFDEAPYAVGDHCKYSGIFTYSGTEDARVIRYFDKEGFTKLN